MKSSLDMVLLDLGLPRLSGHEVLQRIRLDSVNKNLPVVILSTSSNPTDIELAASKGASKFITKPLDLSEFEVLAKNFVSKEFPIWTEKYFV